jgi:hypothetical protein
VLGQSLLEGCRELVFDGRRPRAVGARVEVRLHLGPHGQRQLLPLKLEQARPRIVARHRA